MEQRITLSVIASILFAITVIKLSLESATEYLELNEAVAHAVPALEAATPEHSAEIVPRTMVPVHGILSDSSSKKVASDGTTVAAPVLNS